jgi:hypothetical protein
MRHLAITTFLLLIFFIAVTSLTSCNLPHGKIVTVRDIKENTVARGVVVGPKLVLTLRHCIDGVFDGGKIYIRLGRTLIAATVVNEIRGRWDNVVLLEVDRCFDWYRHDWFIIDHKARPLIVYLRHNGKKKWDSAKAFPGDSGSPVVDSKGRLVGLVYGHYLHDNTAIMERIPRGILKILR